MIAGDIECWYTSEPPQRGGSSGYPLSVFLGVIRKDAYPCKPHFYYKGGVCYEMDKTNISMFEILEPGDQL